MKGLTKAAEFRKSVIVESSWKNVVEFDYTNQKGEESHKRAEVYDVKDDMFFGWCLEENKTKLFKFKSIRNLRKAEEFKPRFERKQ